MSNRLGRKIYAVKKGIKTGIFHSWEECEEQVKGVSGAEYKSFTSMSDALLYLGSPSAIRNTRLDKDLAAVMAGSSKRKLPKIIPVSTDGTPFAFVDGSFNPETNVYGYGGFICAGDKKFKLQGSGNDPMEAGLRNVAGEIMGVEAAVRAASAMGLKDLIIHYDYAGLENWATGKWKAKTLMSKEYTDFMKAAEISGLNVTFKKEDAHTIGSEKLSWGIVNNERADILAKRAVGLDDLADAAQRKLDRVLRAEGIASDTLDDLESMDDYDI